MIGSQFGNLVDESNHGRRLPRKTGVGLTFASDEAGL